MASTYKIGDKVSLTKAFSEEEVLHFSRLSTDTNPIHLDHEFASASVFGSRIVHGMLAAGLFSALLGRELPGAGTIYLGQQLSFKKPIFIDEEVTASVEIIKIREDKLIITLETLCVNSKGEIVIEGEAVVKAT